MRHGIGSAYFPDGSLKYTGTWKYSYPNGVGTAYYSIYDESHANKDNFMSQSVHGIFRNGILVGQAPPQDKTTRNLFSENFVSSQYKVADNIYEYLRNITSSIYQSMAFSMKSIIQNIPNVLEMFG